MATPTPPASPNDNKPNPDKKPPKNDFPRGPENRGPKQKIDRTHPVSGARRVNRSQGR